MNLLMTTWIYVTVVARSCHTLNIQPRNQSKELEVTGKPPCREDQFWCMSKSWSNCIPMDWICDGTCDCDSCEDDNYCGPDEEPINKVKRGDYRHYEENRHRAKHEENSLQNEIKTLENIMEHFWTFFLVCAILSVLCLGWKKKEIATSEDVEQSQPRDNATSASQHLPSYYLHTLHRPQCPLPETEIHGGISGTSGNVNATNSSTGSSQIHLPPPNYEDANLPPSYEEVVRSHRNGSLSGRIEDPWPVNKETQL